MLQVAQVNDRLDQQQTVTTHIYTQSMRNKDEYVCK